MTEIINQTSDSLPLSQEISEHKAKTDNLENPVPEMVEKQIVQCGRRLIEKRVPNRIKPISHISSSKLKKSEENNSSIENPDLEMKRKMERIYITEFSSPI